MAKRTAAELFGPDVVVLAVLLHLAERTKELNDGPFRAGWEAAIEEAGAYIDLMAKDGRDTMQTLMEQVVGLMNGSYVPSLIMHERATITKCYTTAAGTSCIGHRERRASCSMFIVSSFRESLRRPLRHRHFLHRHRAESGKSQNPVCYNARASRGCTPDPQAV